LKEKKSKLEQLRNVVKSADSEISNSNENKFPVGLVISGGVILTLVLVAVLVIRKRKKKV